MRLLGYIALLAGLFYAFVLYAKSKIELSVSLAKLDITKLIAIMTSGGKAILTTDLDINVKNDNAFTIRASRLNVEIFYQETLIAKSAMGGPQKIVILPKYEDHFIHTLDVILSQKFFDVIKTLKSGEPLILQYIIRLRLFGIPITYKDNFTYTK